MEVMVSITNLFLGGALTESFDLCGCPILISSTDIKCIVVHNPTIPGINIC